MTVSKNEEPQRRVPLGRRTIVFGASRSAWIWAAIFLLVNTVLTILVWRGFRNL